MAAEVEGVELRLEPTQKSPDCGGEECMLARKSGACVYRIDGPDVMMSIYRYNSRRQIVCEGLYKTTESERRTRGALPLMCGLVVRFELEAGTDATRALDDGENTRTETTS